MKKLLVLLLLLAEICLLCGCQPKSLGSVKSELKSTLTVGFTYIRTEKTDDKVTYVFRDENGVEFCYITYKNNISIDGSVFGYNWVGYNTYCQCAIAANKDELVALAEASGLEFAFSEGKTEIISITINNHEDVYKCAALVADMLEKQGTLHVADTVAVPEFAIAVQNINIASISFCRDGEQLLAADSAETLIMQCYADAVRSGKIVNDLTDDQLAMYPATELVAYADGVRIAELAFFEKDGVFSAQLQGLVPGASGVSMGIAEFEAVCQAMGIQYAVYDTCVQWGTRNYTYSASLNDENSLTICRAADEVCTLQPYYTYNSMYLFDVSLEDFALMTDSSYTLDFTFGTVTFTAN